MLNGKNEVDPKTGLSNDIQDFTNNVTSEDISSFLGMAPEKHGRQSGTISPEEEETFAKRGIAWQPDDSLSAEELRARKQSAWDQWGNGIVKFAGKTGTAFLGGTAGTLYGIGSAFANGSFTKFYDNDFQHMLDNWNEYMDSELPNYLTKYQQEANFWQSMGTANFWANDVLGAASFTAGAVLTELATAGLGGALLGTRAAKVLSRLKKAGKITKQDALILADSKKALAKLSAPDMKALNRSRVLDNLGSFSRRIVTGTGYEAAVEARHYKEEALNKLLAEYKEFNFGQEPSEEEYAKMVDQVNRTANGVFAANVALVGFSNFATLPKTFGYGIRKNAVRNELKRQGIGEIAETAESKVGKRIYQSAWDSYSKGRKAGTIAYRTIRKPISEGLVEEGGQSVAAGTALNYVTKRMSPDAHEENYNLFEALGETLSEKAGDKQFWKEVGIGAIIGGSGMAHLNVSKYKKTGEIKDLFEWQGGTVLQELANEQGYSLEREDFVGAKNAESDMFFTYMLTRYQAGMFDTLEDDLVKNISDMSEEEFAKEFGYENESKENLRNRKNHVIEKTKKDLKRFKSAIEEAEQRNITEDPLVTIGLANSIYAYNDTDARIRSIVEEIVGEVDGLDFRTVMGVYSKNITGIERRKKFLKKYKNQLAGLKGQITKLNKQLQDPNFTKDSDKYQKALEKRDKMQEKYDTKINEVVEKIAQEKEDRKGSKSTQDFNITLDEYKDSVKKELDGIVEVQEKLREHYATGLNGENLSEDTVVDMDNLQRKLNDLELLTGRKTKLFDEINNLYSKEGQEKFLDNIKEFQKVLGESLFDKNEVVYGNEAASRQPDFIEKMIASQLDEEYNKTLREAQANIFRQRGLMLNKIALEGLQSADPKVNEIVQELEELAKEIRAALRKGGYNKAERINIVNTYTEQLKKLQEKIDDLYAKERLDDYKNALKLIDDLLAELEMFRKSGTTPPEEKTANEASGALTKRVDFFGELTDRNNESKGLTQENKDKVRNMSTKLANEKGRIVVVERLPGDEATEFGLNVTDKKTKKPFLRKPGVSQGSNETKEVFFEVQDPDTKEWLRIGGLVDIFAFRMPDGTILNPLVNDHLAYFNPDFINNGKVTLEGKRFQEVAKALKYNVWDKIHSGATEIPMSEISDKVKLYFGKRMQSIASKKGEDAAFFVPVHERPSIADVYLNDPNADSFFVTLKTRNGDEYKGILVVERREKNDHYFLVQPDGTTIKITDINLKTEAEQIVNFATKDSFNEGTNVSKVLENNKYYTIVKYGKLEDVEDSRDRYQVGFATSKPLEPASEEDFNSILEEIKSKIQTVEEQFNDPEVDNTTVEGKTLLGKDTETFIPLLGKDGTPIKENFSAKLRINRPYVPKKGKNAGKQQPPKLAFVIESISGNFQEGKNEKEVFFNIQYQFTEEGDLQLLYLSGNKKNWVTVKSYQDIKDVLNHILNVNSKAKSTIKGQQGEEIELNEEGGVSVEIGGKETGHETPEQSKKEKEPEINNNQYVASLVTVGDLHYNQAKDGSNLAQLGLNALPETHFKVLPVVMRSTPTQPKPEGSSPKGPKSPVSNSPTPSPTGKPEVSDSSLERARRRSRKKGGKLSIGSQSPESKEPTEGSLPVVPEDTGFLNLTEDDGITFSIKEDEKGSSTDRTTMINNLKEILPDWVSIKNIEVLLDNFENKGITYGAFKNAAIYLAENAPEGTEYHEAFHAVFRTMLSDSEINRYYKYASKKFGVPSDKQLEDLKNSSSAYTNLSRPQLIDLFYEEQMAEDFRKFVLNRKAELSVPFWRRLFNKIWRFIKGLINRSQDLNALFEDIYLGKFKTAEKNKYGLVKRRSGTDTTFALLRQIKEVTKEGKKTFERDSRVFSPEWTDRLTNTIALKYIQSNQDGELNAEGKPKTLKDIYEEVVERYNPDNWEDELIIINEKYGEAIDAQIDEAIYRKHLTLTYQSDGENYDAFRSLEKTILRKVNIFKEQTIEEEAEEDEILGMENDSGLIKKSIMEVGGFGSASRTMRQYIALTEDFYDEFGLESLLEEAGYPIDKGESKYRLSVNAYKIYNSTERAMAGVPKGQMLPRFREFAKSTETVRPFYEKLMKDIKVDLGLSSDEEVFNLSYDQLSESNYFNLFASTFDKFKANPIVLLYNLSGTGETEINVFNANRRDVHLTQYDEWSSSYRARNIKALVAESVWKNVFKMIADPDIFKHENLEQGITNVKTELEKVGMNLSRGFIRHTILSYHMQDHNLTNIPSQLELARSSKVDQDGNNSAEYLQSLVNETEIFSDIEPITAEDIEQILSTIKKVGDTSDSGFYTKPEPGKADEYVYGRLLRIALSNSVFDETVAPSTYQNPEGKTIFDKIYNNYYSDETKRLNDFAKHLKPFLSHLEREEIDEAVALLDKFYRKHDLIYSPEELRTIVYSYMHNPLLQGLVYSNDNTVQRDLDMAAGILSNLSLQLDAGVRQAMLAKNDDGDVYTASWGPSKEGKSFKNLDARAKLLSDMIRFANSGGSYSNIVHTDSEGKKIKTNTRLFRVGVNAEKSTNYLMDLPIHRYWGENGLTTLGVEAIRELFFQEYRRIQAAYRGQLVNGEGYSNDRALKFFNFKNMDPDVLAVFEELAKTVSVAEISDENIELLDSAIRQFADNQVEDLKDNMLESKMVLDKEGTLTSTVLPQHFLADKKVLMSEVGNFAMNDYINTHSIANLYDLDGAMFENSFDRYVKRNSSRIASGPGFGSGNTNMIILEDEVIPGRHSDSTVEATDGQTLGTVAFHNKYLKALGKYPKSVRIIMKKLERGLDLTENEKEIYSKLSSEYNADLRPRKIVARDKFLYLKTSVQTLLLQDLAIRKISNEELESLWDQWDQTSDLVVLDQILDSFEPLPGRENKLNLLKKMMMEGVDLAAYESAVKTLKQGVVKRNSDGLYDFDFYSSFKVNDAAFREQVSTDKDKDQVVDGTQKLQIIWSEQNDDFEITLNNTKFKLKDVIPQYQKALYKRIKKGLNKLDFDLYVDKETGEVRYDVIGNSLVRSAEASKSDPYIIELFTVLMGAPKYNWNFPAIVTKTENGIFSYMSKETLKQKVAGNKFTLASSSDTPVLINTKTGETIFQTDYRKLKPSERKKYSSRELQYRTEGDVFYAEAIVSKSILRRYNIDPDNVNMLAVPPHVLEIMGIRIPTQDNHSMAYLKIVDVVDDVQGPIIYMPHDIVELSGADFDIDSLFGRMYEAFGSKNKFSTKYGHYLEAPNEDVAIQRAYIEYKNARRTETNLPKLNEDDFLLKYGQQIKKNWKVFTKTNKLENYSPITKKELNNFLLDIEKQMVANEGNRRNAFTPATSRHFEDLEDKLREKGIDVEGEKMQTVHGSADKYRITHAIGVGEGAIGVTAKFNTLFQLLAQNQIKINELNLPFNDPNYSTYGFGSYQEGNRVNDMISTLITAAVDNAKLLYNVKYNLTRDTLGSATQLMALTKDFNLTMTFMKHPVIGEFVKLKEYMATPLRSKTEDQYITNILYKLLNGNTVEAALQNHVINVIKSDSELWEYISEKLNPDNSKSDHQIAKKLIANLRDEMKENEDLRFNSRESINSFEVLSDALLGFDDIYDDLRVSILVADEFSSLEKGSEELRKISTISGLTQGMKATEAENLTIERAINFLRARTQLKREYKKVYDKKVAKGEIIYPGLEDLIEQEGTYLRGLVDAFMENMDTIGKFVIHASHPIRILKQEGGFFSSEFESKFFNSNVKIKDLNRNLIAFLTAKAVRHDSKSEYKVNDLFNESIINDYNTLLEDENFKDNRLLKFLRDESSEYGESSVFPGLTFYRLVGNTRTAKDPDYVESLIDGYRELLSSVGENSDTAKRFALSLAKYVFLKDNFLFRNNSVVRQLGPIILDHPSKALNKVQKLMAGDPNYTYEKVFGMSQSELWQEFLDLTMRNSGNKDFVQIEWAIAKKIGGEKSIAKFDNIDESSEPDIIINRSDLNTKDPSKSLPDITNLNFVNGAAYKKKEDEVIIHSKRYFYYKVTSSNNRKEVLYKRVPLTESDIKAGVLVRYIPVDAIAGNQEIMPYAFSMEEWEAFYDSLEAYKETGKDSVEDSPKIPTSSGSPSNSSASSGTINIDWGKEDSEDNIRILSNLAPREFQFLWPLARRSDSRKPHTYKSVEHAYQTLKSGSFDKETYDAYMKAGGYGVKIRGKEADRSSNLELMELLVQASFDQNPNSEATRKLLQFDDFTHNNSTDPVDLAFIRGLKEVQRKLRKGGRAHSVNKQETFLNFVLDKWTNEIKSDPETTSAKITNVINALEKGLADETQVKYETLKFKDINFNVERLRDFITKAKALQNRTNQSKFASTERIGQEKADTILRKLKDQFGLNYRFDSTIDSVGEFDPMTNEIIINPDKVAADTPFHEFAHPLVFLIKTKNKALYGRLVKEMMDNHKDVYNRVKMAYTSKFKSEGLSDRALESAIRDEALVTAIGIEAAQHAAKPETKESGFYRALKRAWERFVRYIKDALNIKSIPINVSELSTITDVANFMNSGEKLNLSSEIDNAIDEMFNQLQLDGVLTKDC